MQHIPEDADPSLADYIRNLNEEPDVYYPRPERGQKWAIAGLIALLLGAALLGTWLK